MPVTKHTTRITSTMQTTNPKMQHEKEGAGSCCKEGNLQGAKLDQASPLGQRWEQSPGGKGGPSPRPFLKRTPAGTQRNCNASFKSPVPSPRACQPMDKETLQREIEELKNKSTYLDQEIAHLSAEGYSVEELESHIALLHEYNEIKDTGQMLLGRLVIRGVTTKDLYPAFDLDLND
ncbi:DNA repair protein SWI5 homolog isoform X2 [Sceloporus undulatus]|uniref:DNA repair protein SWI5 homolog isoform X2 n=1 Tax=Sceloporus undulatus TaxID=8520 RepID=UPI001C4D519B|nr:DNA repair protein SWI5 homolog isoform X2 [Sceloporus undulatus]